MPRASGAKIRGLDRKLGTIISRLETIERILSDSLEHPELASTISNLRAGVLLVKEPITALDRLSSARKYLQLCQSGLDIDTAHKLAKTYREANRQVIRNITSPMAWARNQNPQSHSIFPTSFPA